MTSATLAVVLAVCVSAIAIIGALWRVVRALWRAVWVLEAALRTIASHEERIQRLERRQNGRIAR